MDHPANWETFRTDNATEEQIAEMLEDLADGPSELVTLFNAGLPAAPGHNPNMNVNVLPIPEGMTLDEYLDASLLGLTQSLPSYELVDDDRATTASGDDSAIVTGSYAVADISGIPGSTGRYWMVQVLVASGTSGWTVTCGSVQHSQADAETHLETCDTVARSFELLGN